MYKFVAVFPETVLTKLDDAEESVVVPINSSLAAVKAVAVAGGSAAVALTAADQKTDTALSTTASTAGRAIDKTKGNVGSSLKQAFRTVRGTLSGEKK
jgi:hypothetical protein